jgi:hypothetical protein
MADFFVPEKNIKKGIFTNVRICFLKIKEQFLNLDPDPDPATQINSDPDPQPRLFVQIRIHPLR